MFLNQIKEILANNFQHFVLKENILAKEIYLKGKANKMEILAETIDRIENKKGIIQATFISQNRIILIYDQEK